MNAIGTGYRVLGALFVLGTAGLTALTIAEGHVAAAARLDAIHAARQLGVALRKHDRVVGDD